MRAFAIQHNAVNRGPIYFTRLYGSKLFGHERTEF